MCGIAGAELWVHGIMEPGMGVQYWRGRDLGAGAMMGACSCGSLHQKSAP